MNAVEAGGRVLWILLVVGLLSGFGSGVVFRRFTDGARIRRTINLMLAHVLELRLFLDEPALVLRAQRDLLRENWRLLRLVALPCAILAIPFTLLMWQLDEVFGHAALVVGAPAVVTLQVAAAGESEAGLRTPLWIAVETPPVHAGDRQISWRIRPLAAGAGTIEATVGGRVFTANVRAGDGWGVFWRGGELTIPYPGRVIFGLNWVIWFLPATAAGALIKRP